MTAELITRLESADGPDRELDAYQIWSGIDAEFCAGYLDGKNPSTPEPSANRHPAYRHSWEVARLEIQGTPIPAAWSRDRAAHIHAGGDFYPYAVTAAAALKARGV